MIITLQTIKCNRKAKIKMLNAELFLKGIINNSEKVFDLKAYSSNNID